MKIQDQSVEESQPVQRHIISQQLLISLIDILEYRRNIRTEGHVKGVSVVIFYIKQALRSEGSKAIPFWQQERSHTWQPLTDLKANLFS